MWSQLGVEKRKVRVEELHYWFVFCFLFFLFLLFIIFFSPPIVFIFLYTDSISQ